MAVRCGNKVHREFNAAAEAHHDSVAQVKLCYRRPVRSHEELDADEQAEWDYAHDGDLAYERFLERPVEGEEFGSDGLYDYERQMGCVSFSDAMRAAEEAREDRSREVSAGI